MMLPSAPPMTRRLTLLTYVPLLRDVVRQMCAPREPVVQGWYAQQMGRNQPIGPTVAETRALYQTFVRGRGGAVPDAATLLRCETHHVLTVRLQGAWLLCWLFLFPAIYPVTMLVRAAQAPGRWPPVLLGCYLLTVIIFTLLLWVLGLLLQSLLFPAVRILLARLMRVPTLPVVSVEEK